MAELCTDLCPGGPNADAIGSASYDRLIFSEPIPNRLVATHVAWFESDAPKFSQASAFVDSCVFPTDYGVHWS